MTSTDHAERGEPVARQRLVVVDGLIYPVGPVPPQYRSPGIRRLLKLSVKASVDVNPTRKSWEKPDEIEVFKAASQVSHNMGGIAWSLNLSQKKIQQLKKTAANGNDPTRPLTMAWEEETVERIIRRYVSRTAAIRERIRKLNESRA